MTIEQNESECTAKRNEMKAAFDEHIAAMKTINTEIQNKNAKLRTKIETIENKYKTTCTRPDGSRMAFGMELMKTMKDMNIGKTATDGLTWVESKQTQTFQPHAFQIKEWNTPWNKSGDWNRKLPLFGH